MAKEVKYVGLSLKDARAALAERVKTGTRADGTKLAPKVHDALSHLNKSLEDRELVAASHYIVCWSEGCIIVIDHVPDPGPIRQT